MTSPLLFFMRVEGEGESVKVVWCRKCDGRVRQRDMCLVLWSKLRHESFVHGGG